MRCENACDPSSCADLTRSDESAAGTLQFTHHLLRFALIQMPDTSVINSTRLPVRSRPQAAHFTQISVTTP